MGRHRAIAAAVRDEQGAAELGRRRSCRRRGSRVARDARLTATGRGRAPATTSARRLLHPQRLSGTPPYRPRSLPGRRRRRRGAGRSRAAAFCSTRRSSWPVQYARVVHATRIRGAPRWSRAAAANRAGIRLRAHRCTRRRWSRRGRRRSRPDPRARARSYLSPRPRGVVRALFACRPAMPHSPTHVRRRTELARFAGGCFRLSRWRLAGADEAGRGTPFGGRSGRAELRLLDAIHWRRRAVAAFVRSMVLNHFSSAR